MLQNDFTQYRPICRKTLSTQVMEIAQKNEVDAVTALSDTLPRTPKAWTQQQQTPDDEQAHKTGGHEPQQIVSKEPPSKKRKVGNKSEQQLVQLTPWMLQTFHANPPVDLGRAHPRIDRKDAKFRWASYSRVPPRLNNMAKHSSNQVVAPPFGIQLTSIVSTLDTGDFRPHHLNNPSETLRGCTGWIHRCYSARWWL